MEAFIINNTPKNIRNKSIFLPTKVSVDKREPAAWLTTPIERNKPIEVQPWDRDSRAILQ
jgi:hypothetical protein